MHLVKVATVRVCAAKLSVRSRQRRCGDTEHCTACDQHPGASGKCSMDRGDAEMSDAF
jgi:hypothetical protein